MPTKAVSRLISMWTKAERPLSCGCRLCDGNMRMALARRSNERLLKSLNNTNPNSSRSGMHFLENRIKSLKISGAHLAVELLDGRAIRLRLSFFPTLAEASADQRSNWELCGAGTGIRWPMLDYDLSVAGLLRGEPEAPGIRRARKPVKYPAHQAGRVRVLREQTPSRKNR